MQGTPCLPTPARRKQTPRVRMPGAGALLKANPGRARTATLHWAPTGCRRARSEAARPPRPSCGGGGRPSSPQTRGADRRGAAAHVVRGREKLAGAGPAGRGGAWGGGPRGARFRWGRTCCVTSPRSGCGARTPGAPRVRRAAQASSGSRAPGSTWPARPPASRVRGWGGGLPGRCSGRGPRGSASCRPAI